LCNYEGRGNNTGILCNSIIGCDKRSWVVCNDQYECEDRYDENQLLFDCEYWKIKRKFRNYCSQRSRTVDGSHQYFGMAMLTPVILATFFTLFQWWRIEENWSKRLKTLPFVLLLCWPQYRVVKILYLGFWKKVSQWKTENNILKKRNWTY